MTQSTRQNIILYYINEETPLNIAIRKLNLTKEEQEWYKYSLSSLKKYRKTNPKAAYRPVESDWE